MSTLDASRERLLSKALATYENERSNRDSQNETSSINNKFTSLFSDIEDYKSASEIAYTDLTNLYCNGIKSLQSLFVAKFYILQALKGFNRFKSRSSILKSYNSSFKESMQRFNYEISDSGNSVRNSTISAYKSNTSELASSVAEIFDNRPFIKNGSLFDPAVLQYKYKPEDLSKSSFSEFTLTCNPLYFTEEMEKISEITLSFSANFSAGTTWMNNLRFMLGEDNKFHSEVFSITLGGILYSDIEITIAISDNSFFNPEKTESEDYVDASISITKLGNGGSTIQETLKIERISGGDLSKLPKNSSNPSPANYDLLSNLLELEEKLANMIAGNIELAKIAEIGNRIESFFLDSSLENSLMNELGGSIEYIRDLLLSFFFFEGKRVSEDSSYKADYVEELQNNFYSLAGALNDYIKIDNSNLTEAIECGEPLEGYLKSISTQTTFLIETVDESLNKLGEVIAENRVLFQTKESIKDELIDSTNKYIDLLKSRTDNVEKYWTSIPEGFKTRLNDLWLGEAKEVVNSLSSSLGTDQEEYMVSLISLQTTIGTGFPGSKLYGLPNFVRSFSEWKETIQTSSFSEVDSLIRLYSALEIGLYGNGFDPSNIEFSDPFAAIARRMANEELVRETKKNMFKSMDIVYKDGVTASSINSAISSLVDREHFIFDADYGKFKISSVLLTVIPELKNLNNISFDSIFTENITMNDIKQTSLYKEIRFFIFKSIFSGGRLKSLQTILKLLRTIPNIKEFSFKTALVLYIIDEILRETEGEIRPSLSSDSSLSALSAAFQEYYSGLDKDSSNGEAFNQKMERGIETFITTWVQSFDVEDRFIVDLLNDREKRLYLSNKISETNSNVPYNYERLYVNPATGFTGVENKLVLGGE